MARVRFAVLYVLAWVPLAALYALVLGSRPGMDMFSTIMATIWTIGSAALFGAIVWWLSNRIQFQGAQRVRFLGIHAILAIVGSEVAIGVIRGSQKLELGITPLEREFIN